jgi:hypothetical protein
MMSIDRYEDRLRELASERDPRKRQRLATSIGTSMIRSASRKRSASTIKTFSREWEKSAPNKSKWRPLSQLGIMVKRKRI